MLKSRAGFLLQQTTTSNTDTTSKVTVDGNAQQQFSQLLSYNLNIKNTLATGDATSASVNTNQFLQTANTSEIDRTISIPMIERVAIELAEV